MKFLARQDLETMQKATKFFTETERIKEVTLPEFLEVSENFETIPASRIKKITKNGEVLFEKKPASS